MHQALFIHLPIERHVGCFKLLAIISKVVVNIHGRFVGKHELSTYLGKYQGTLSLNHMVRVYLVL